MPLSAVVADCAVGASCARSHPGWAERGGFWSSRLPPAHDASIVVAFTPCVGVELGSGDFGICSSVGDVACCDVGHGDVGISDGTLPYLADDVVAFTPCVGAELGSGDAGTCNSVGEVSCYCVGQGNVGTMGTFVGTTLAGSEACGNAGVEAVLRFSGIVPKCHEKPVGDLVGFDGDSLLDGVHVGFCAKKNVSVPEGVTSAQPLSWHIGQVASAAVAPHCGVP
jgi:hypothetical protein